MLDPIAMRELSDQAGSWQHGVVAPIRKARRALKNCSLDLDGGLYKQAKALEIGAEKAIILKLGAMFPVGLQVSADIAALANLEVYRRLLDSTENLFASVLTDFGNYQAEMPQ